MSFLKRLFGERGERATKTAGGPPPEPAPSPAEPAADPDTIRVYDAYGREMFVTKREWRDKVLPGALDGARDDPDRLFAIIVSALRDGFAEDVVAHAEHLERTDSIPSRGAALLGVVYLQVGRLDDAERVLQNRIASHGDDGGVLTNLAKVHQRRGEPARAEATLWHALEVDPNQDNGLKWYAAIHRDRGGEAGALEAFRRVAALPGSWRARLWLARDALQQGDLSSALTLYRESLARAEQPPPADLLMQMSGDLGNEGHVREIVDLAGPAFDAALHGLGAGNNLIKANLELERYDDAKRILDLLYAQQHPDWRQSLEFWDTELAKARLRAAAIDADAQPRMTLLSIEGPLWARSGSPFAALLKSKPAGAPRVALFGSTALLDQRLEQPGVHLSDAPGRFSRALPLVLAEQIHLGSTAWGIAMIPRSESLGFPLFGSPYEDQDLCQLASMEPAAAAYVANVVVDARRDPWTVSLRLIRTSDGTCVAHGESQAPISDPGQAVAGLCRTLIPKLTEAGASAVDLPPWYILPQGTGRSDYLLRLEQQLALVCHLMVPFPGGGLFGEHEILDGALQLCLRDAANPTPRMLYAQTMRLMKRVRPDILPEYKDRTDLLQRDHPIRGEAGELVANALEEAFTP